MCDEGMRFSSAWDSYKVVLVACEILLISREMWLENSFLKCRNDDFEWIIITI